MQCIYFSHILYMFNIVLSAGLLLPLLLKTQLFVKRSQHSLEKLGSNTRIFSHWDVTESSRPELEHQPATVAAQGASCLQPSLTVVSGRHWEAASTYHTAPGEGISGDAPKKATQGRAGVLDLCAAAGFLLAALLQHPYFGLRGLKPQLLHFWTPKYLNSSVSYLLSIQFFIV